MIRRPSLALLACLGLALPVAAGARDVLGVFQRWGAFREMGGAGGKGAGEARCFAIAQPLAGGWEASPWRPFASIGYWPRRQLRGQLNIRLSHQLAPGSGATLSVGGQRFALSGGGADVWAAERRADAAILAAMRSGGTMSVTGRATAGGIFTDRYDLRGAATAIDAAALGCARLK